jgi:hypothetical protein
MATNYTQQLVTQQLALRSGQIGISANNGGYQYVDQTTGKILNGQPVASNLLANPQQPNDPKLIAYALDRARGYFSAPGTPPELVEAIASVAAYTSATQGVSVDQLFPQGQPSSLLIGSYNAFKPKGSQVGLLTANQKPSWANNITQRGSIAAALSGQP